MENAEKASENSIVLSFLLPCYNVAKYIKDSVDSIVSGCSGIEYEIIAVDDASTDDTLSKLNELASLYPCLNVAANEKNSGVSVTRNKLLEMATGEYVWFVDRQLLRDDRRRND